MQKEKARVHYLSSGQNHIVRTKDVIILSYKKFNLYMLDEERMEYSSSLLYKDSNGEYWNFYIASASFERFNTLINNECSDYEKKNYINYCNFIIEKIKYAYENYESYVKEKIGNSKYFNIIELAYLEKYYPELYPLAQKSREQFSLLINQQREQEELQERNRKSSEVKNKNEKFKNKVNEIKKLIADGKEVLSEQLNYYKNDDYYNEVYQNNFLYLLKDYDIDVPLKTQGWINSKLYSYNFSNSTCLKYGKYSCQTIYDCFEKLKSKIVEEKQRNQSIDQELDITDEMY